MKLVMMGELRTNCGSINAFIGYERAARRRGFNLKIADTRKTSPSWLKKAAADADYVLFVIEHALNGNHKNLIQSVSPRKRVLVDVDANLELGDYELKHYLNDAFPTVLQPTTRNIKTEENVIPFYFFGYEPFMEIPLRGVHKAFDLLYVGNNWFRWDEVKRVIDECSRVLRPKPVRIGIFGKWWTGWRPKRIAYAVKTERHYFTSRGVCINPAVPNSKVSTCMSLGAVNIVLLRKEFREMQILTPRVFETIAADTLPFFNVEETMLEPLYGASIQEFMPGSSNGLLYRFNDMLLRPEYYQRAMMCLRQVCREKHTYDCRLSELAGLLEKLPKS